MGNGKGWYRISFRQADCFCGYISVATFQIGKVKIKDVQLIVDHLPFQFFSPHSVR